MIITRPYIKKVVNEVKFTYVAKEYKTTKKIEKTKKQKKIVQEDDKPEIRNENDNTISLTAETTLNLFDDLGYDLKGVRAGQKVKPIYLTKLPKELQNISDGYTYFKIPSLKYDIAYPPLYNRVLMFPSNILHKGGDLNRFVKDIRITVAWKFKEKTNN